jgi:integrase
MKSAYLDTDTIKKLCKNCSREEWLPFWVSLETGLRIGDVLALKRSQVKPDGLHFKAQKTGKRGVAKISAKLRAALPQKGKLLFPSPRKCDKPLTRQAAWARIKRAGKRAGIDLEGVSPHSLRKVFAVELYREKGFNAVKDALQHNNAATTEIYSFADWSTGQNAEKPLKRKDLQLIVHLVIEALGDGYKLKPESKKRRSGGTERSGETADRPQKKGH